MSFPVRIRIAAAGALVALVAAACTGSEGAEPASSGATTTTVKRTTSTTQEPATSTTSSSSTTSTTAKPPPPGLRVGSKGAEVQALEEKLASMHYEVGRVDGVYDTMTHHGVMAFQKVNSMRRTGQADPATIDAIKAAITPPPMIAGGGSTKVEVDLKRQVLFLYKDGGLLRIINTSTGSGKRYCVDGECATAVTPGGSFRVTRKILGLRVSRLGELYDPVYFNGGIAIHGSPSVPAYPASHGCVRVPMPISRWVYDQLDKGTPVYVLGGPRAPVPFNEQAPGEETTTTTTSSTTTSTTTSSSTTSTTTTTTAPTTTSTTPPAS